MSENKILDNQIVQDAPKTPIAAIKSNVKKFALDSYEFDQNTFLGRLKHQAFTTSPLLMFKTKDEINHACKVLKEYSIDSEAVEKKYDDEQLWKFQTIKRASTNADTGEIIPVPFRLCGFVTFNMPILVGLCFPNPTVPTMIFWQWANQTHNAAVNYCNRNATLPTDYTRLGISYFLACSSAIGVSQGVKKFIDTRSWNTTKKAAVGRFTAFPAVAAANTINMYCMRSTEYMEGIEVQDAETGENIGISRTAAKQAIFETALSRLIISAGVLVLPPLIDNKIQTIIDKKYKNHPQLPKIKLTGLVAVCSLCFYLVLPVSVSGSPQFTTVKVSSLEEHVQKNAKSDYAIFNRGQ